MKTVTLVTNPETGRVDLASRVTTPLYGVTFTEVNVPDEVADDDLEEYLGDRGYFEDPDTL